MLSGSGMDKNTTPASRLNGGVVMEGCLVAPHCKDAALKL